VPPKTFSKKLYLEVSFAHFSISQSSQLIRAEKVEISKLRKITYSIKCFIFEPLQIKEIFRSVHTCPMHRCHVASNYPEELMHK